MRGKNSIVRLIYLGDRLFEIHTAHEVYKARLKSESLITTFLCVLRFEKERKISTLQAALGEKWLSSSAFCIVFKDALPQRQYRRLLILMKNV